jgi:dynein heavy chain
MESAFQYKKELQSLEDQILALLSSGNIMNDEKLVDTLTACRKTVEVITNRIAEAVKTGEEINEARIRYQSVAHHAAILYFCIADLFQIDHMYHFSLSWFLQVFVGALSKVKYKCSIFLIIQSDMVEDTDMRVKLINDLMTDLVYRNVSSAIFEKHKLLFSFLICVRLLGDEVNPDEWRFLLNGHQSDVNLYILLCLFCRDQT